MRGDAESTCRQKVNRVIDYIGVSLHQPLNLEALADHVNISQRQLLRIMRLPLNKSPLHYVARQRLERSALYLQTERMPLALLSRMGELRQPAILLQGV